MTVRATIKFTRPNLDQKFWNEETVFPALIACQYNFVGNYFYEQLGKMPDGFIESTMDEFISWRDIISRKNELRSDLQTWLEQNEFYIQNNSQFESDEHYGPGMNPFSTTFTHHTTFESIENAKDFLRLLRLTDDTLSAIERTNNVVEFYIDGNLVDIDTL
jgi:hypothetical protein